MEPGRNFPLRKGTLLTCISWRNAINNPHLNLYFTSPAEALVSMFREAVVRPFELTIGQEGTTAQNTNPNDDLYLNTFYLTEDILINPMLDSRLARELAEDPTLNEVRSAIQIDCSSVPDKMGYVVPYQATIFHEVQIPVEVTGRNRTQMTKIRPRMTTYVICRPNILIHAQSFRILKDNVSIALTALINAWLRDNPNSRISGGVVIDVIGRFLAMGTTSILEPVFVQPETPGLATSPVQYDPPVPGISPIARLPISAEEEFVASPTITRVPEQPVELSRPIVPPSSMLAPKDPAVFIPQRSSPGGTALDAFASVPSDVVRVIALGMTLDAIAKTCLTSRRFNDLICNNEDFWRLRFQQDFGKRFSQDKDEQISRAAQRKPEGWTWKRYYAEVSGNIPAAQALDFANQLADLPDIAEELKRLPRDQYRARVNEMRIQAGLGPVNFGPVMQLAEQDADELDGFYVIRRPRAGDEAEVVGRVPAGRLQPRNLFRVEPLVPGGVMGPVVEQNPDVDANVAPPGGLLGGGANQQGNELFRQIRRDRALMEAYQRLVLLFNRPPGPRVRAPNGLLAGIIRHLMEREGELMVNLEDDFDHLRLQYPNEWRVEDEPVIREAVRNYIAERRLQPERAGFNMDFDGDEVQAQAPNRRPMAELIRERQGILQVDVRNADVRPVQNEEERFDMYRQLLVAIEGRDQDAIRQAAAVIYRNAGGRANQIQRELAEIQQYPAVINQWPPNAIGRILRVMRDYNAEIEQQRRDEPRQINAMGPQPPQPPLPRIDQQNPPQNVIDSATVLQELANAWRANDQEAYRRVRDPLFGGILINVGNNREAAIQLLEVIINEVMQYNRYAGLLGNYPEILLAQFRDHFNQPIDNGINRVLVQEAQQYIPGFQRLLDRLDIIENQPPTEEGFRVLHEAFGEIYTQAGRNQEDPVETLASILQRLDEVPTWNRDNDEVVMRIFQTVYLGFVRALGEIITLFREVIDNRDPRGGIEARDRVRNILRDFTEQDPPLPNDFYRVLAIFTELHQLDGRILWNPRRDPRLLDDILRQ